MGTYEYNDTVEDRDTNIRGIADSIEAGQGGGARAYLNSFIQESGDPETIAGKGVIEETGRV